VLSTPNRRFRIASPDAIITNLGDATTPAWTYKEPVELGGYCMASMPLGLPQQCVLRQDFASGVNSIKLTEDI